MMEAQIVTLTSDWGSTDFFAARVKGRLCSLIPGVRIFDLSHEQDWEQSMMLMNIIRHGCMAFPAGTIHLIDVGCEFMRAENQLQRENQHFRPTSVLARYRGHYLICSDVRPLALAFEEMPDALVALHLPDALPAYTFLAADLYCDVAQHLADGADPASLGNPVERFTLLRQPTAMRDDHSVELRVDYVDKYGNADLNITFVDFEQLRRGRAYRIFLDGQLGNNDQSALFRSVGMHYNDVRMASLVLTVSGSGVMQLALNRGSAAQLLGLRYGSSCRIVFVD